MCLEQQRSEKKVKDEKRKDMLVNDSSEQRHPYHSYAVIPNGCLHDQKGIE
jgi:hypothetical protein